MSTSTFNFLADPMDLDCRSSYWFYGDMPLSHNINAGSFPGQTMVPPQINPFGTTYMAANSNPSLGHNMNSLYGPNPPAARMNFVQNPDWGFTGFGMPSPLKGSTKEKFQPVVGLDTVLRGGRTESVPIHYQNITAMRTYEDMSMEEIRLEDYYLNRKVDQISPFNVADNQFMKHTALLQNIVSGFNQVNPALASTSRNFIASDPLYGETSVLLQTLLQRIKNRFNLNCISDEARVNCEILAQKLAEFTEKTFDNLTVVVLEDMVNNIKKRDVTSTSFSSVLGNSVSEAGSPRTSFGSEARIKTDKKHIHLKNENKKGRKPANDLGFGSESENCSDYEGEDVIDCNRDTAAEQDQRCETKPGQHRKLTGHLLADNKDTRRRIRSSHQTFFKQDRHAAGRSKAFIKKRDMKCTCVEGEAAIDNDCPSRSNETSRSAWKEERLKKSPGARTKCFGGRTKKKSPRKVNEAVIDECSVCELFRTVSVKDENHAECSPKKKTPYRKEHHSPNSSSDYEDKDNNAGQANSSNLRNDRQHSVKEQIVANMPSDGSTIAADDIHSSSDTSSV